MSALFREQSSGSPRFVIAADTIADHAGRVGRYLTDGVSLYRFLGAVSGGLGEMVGLEDCRSLEVTLLPIGELRARRLRAVCPPDSAPGMRS
jgi:hypothetical protein